MQFLERGAGPRRPRVGCFFIRAAQCVHALDSPLSWLILNICIHILNRCVIHTKQGKLTKVLMAQLSQSSKKKKKKSLTLLFPKQYSIVMRVYSGLPGLPIPIFYFNKGECVCVCTGVGTKELAAGRHTV